MRALGRDERIALVLEQAEANARKRRSAYQERQMKSSTGLPPSRGGGGGGSIVNRSPGRRTTGKHRAN